MIRDDDRPEPDEQFLITLVDPSPGYHVDRARGTITVTIIDDDQPQAPVPVFLFPLDEGDSWEYRGMLYGLGLMTPWSIPIDRTSRVDGTRIFKGNTYARLAGYETRFYSQEGPSVFLVPGDQNLDPPAEQDTLAFGRWQHLPWHLFDASSAAPLAAEGFADTVCYRWDPQFGCWGPTTLLEGVADRGWTAIAVPAGVFRRVRRVSFHTHADTPPPGAFDSADFT